MISTARAHLIVRERVRAPLPPEWAPLPDLLGRVLAEDVIAREDIPRFANSAMDGYAVRAADVALEGVRLDVIGEVAAGAAWTGPHLATGQALRIMTGAPIPAGADAIVRVEDTEESDGKVRIRAIARPGDHVRAAGHDIQAGSLALRAGVVLTPARIGLLAALGRSGAQGIRRPRVAILCTGEEIVDPMRAGADLGLGPGQIWNSNAYGLHAQVLDCGAIPVPLGVCPDDYAATLERLREAIAAADVVLTSGGVSMGRHDHVGTALAELGEVLFTSVAQQPGKPLTFALAGGKPVFALPGNPVSTAVNFELYARPALLRLAGHSDGDRPTLPVLLDEAVDAHPQKTLYIRVRLDGDRATPTGPQGSARWQSLAEADALIVVPPGTGTLEPGTEVRAIRLTPPEGTYAISSPKAQISPPAAISRSVAARLTHFDEAGRAHMVDVSAKPSTLREAVASATVRMQPETLARIRDGQHAKGDVLAVARIAGITGAKRTADWIPLCHPLGLDAAEIEFELDMAGSAVRVISRVRTTGRTGVEMEALCGVSAAALTIYDMCKAVDRGMTVEEIGLLEKRGGKSGTWMRAEHARG